MNSKLFGRAMDTADPFEMPRAASFCWNELMWAFNWAKEKVSADLPGIITAVESDCLGIELKRVDMTKLYMRRDWKRVRPRWKVIPDQLTLCERVDDNTVYYMYE